MIAQYRWGRPLRPVGTTTFGPPEDQGGFRPAPDFDEQPFDFMMLYVSKAGFTEVIVKIKARVTSVVRPSVAESGAAA